MKEQWKNRLLGWQPRRGRHFVPAFFIALLILAPLQSLAGPVYVLKGTPTGGFLLWTAVQGTINRCEITDTSKTELYGEMQQPDLCFIRFKTPVNANDFNPSSRPTVYYPYVVSGNNPYTYTSDTITIHNHYSHEVQAPYSITVSENVQYGQFITKLKYLGHELSGVGHRFFNVSGLDGSVFSIQPDGSIYKGPGTLNAATKNKYDGVVQIESAEKIAITINVIPAADNPPVFNNHTFAVDEGAANGTFVGTFTATDPDPGSTITYQLLSSNTTTFNAWTLSSSGTLTVKNGSLIDYETRTIEYVNIRATSGSKYVDKVFAITVRNIADDPITAKNFNGTINENPAANAYILDLSVGNASGSTYSLVSTPSSALKLSGSQVLVNSPAYFDREQRGYFESTYRVTKGASSATGTIGVFIHDVDEFDPQILTSSFSIPENPATSALIGYISTRDDDATSQPTYSILNASSSFNAVSIDSATGALRVARSEIFDYEARTSLVVRVQAASGSKTTYKDITINITDVSDAPVEYYPQSITLTVNENIPTNTFLKTLPVKDSRGAAITYSFYGVYSDAVKVNGSQLLSDNRYIYDREQRSAINIPFSTDNGYNVGNAQLVIMLNDVDEYSPQLHYREYIAEENTPNGTRIGFISASDDDALPSFTYQLVSINGGPSNSIGVNTTTGEITIKNSAALDSKTTPSFTITVRVNSGAKSVTGNLPITVKPFNNPPVAQDVVFAINENPKKGDFVGKIAFSDPDGMDGVTISIHPYYTDYLTVSSDGTVRINNPTYFDAEQRAYVGAFYIVSDGEKSVSRGLRVDINDLDEFDPTAPDQTFTVSEDVANGWFIGQLLGKDQDRTAVSVYTITGGTNSNAFTINNKGEFRVANRTLIDYETYPIMTINYSVSSGAKVANGKITVNVTNVDDTAPVAPDATFTVDENPQRNQVLGVLEAYDPDGFRKPYFTILYGPSNAVKIVTPQTGYPEVQVDRADAYDRETASKLTIGYRAHDGSQTSSGVITIVLNDVNEFTPTLPSKSFNVVENPVQGHVIGSVVGADGDATAVLSYSIVAGGTDAGSIAVDSTGKLTVSNPAYFDYEARKVITVNLRVSDGTKTATSLQTINLINVNDDAPVAEDLSVNINENPIVNTVIGTVVYDDPDGKSTVTLSIHSGNIDNAIALASDGKVTIKKPAVFDREVRDSLSVVYKATDGIASVYKNINITINDVDEFPTQVPAKEWDLFENSPNGTVVGNMEVLDDDATKPTFTWSITSGNQGAFKGLFQGRRVPFAINATTGAITVIDRGDFYNPMYPSYTLGIRATGSSTFNTRAKINITDINASAPVLDDATFTIAENTVNGTEIATLVATDPDLDPIEYTIVGGNTLGAFALNKTNGKLTVADSSKLDREQVDSFVLTVRAYDGGKEDTALITVNLTDVNEFAPVIPATAFTVDENVPNNTVVGTIPATDGDATAKLTYSITAGNAGSSKGFLQGNRTLFAINPNTGVLTVADNYDFNFEVNQQFTITISVTDGVTARTAQSVITIANVNEFAPATTNKVVTIDENPAAGMPVADASATDADGSDVLTYSISSGNLGDAFEINSSTGAVKVKTPVYIDREAVESFNLALSVTDGKHVVPYSLKINLNDLDEFDISASDKSFTMNETEPAGYVVGSLDAFDADATAVLSYQLVSGNTPNAFAVNATTGIITVANPSVIDDRTTPEFNLSIKITSGSKTKTVIAKITILRVNAYDPSISDKTFTIPENSVNGFSVGSLAGTDADNDLLTYRIVSGNESNIFSIDQNNGLLTVADNTLLDRESIEEVILVYEASDGERSSTATATIKLSDVNEFTPDIQNQELHVLEKSPNGTIVGAVQASDLDATAVLSYSITAGNTGSSKGFLQGNRTPFAINSQTGGITVADNYDLNLDSYQEFNLTVRVSDGSKNKSATVKIIIDDLNEYAPELSDKTVTIAENSPNSSLVAVMTATDRDARAVLEYSIVAGNTESIFAINAQTGRVVVDKSSSLDAEVYDSFSLLISVNDGDFISTAVLVVNVSDVNEFAPELSVFATSINENTPNGTSIGILLASDKDRDASLQYTITSFVAGGGLVVDPVTGAIKVSDSQYLNRESLVDIVANTQVSDGTFTSSSSATITLVDVNEFAPVLTEHHFEVFETDPINTLVGVVKATDADATSFLTYKIVSGNQDGLFKIDATTGRISIASKLDAETTSTVILTIEVSDGAQVGTGITTISIRDVNEFAPVLLPQQGINIDENSPVGALVFTPVATDQDATFDHVFSITKGNDSGAFTINPITGDVLIADPLFFDAETRLNHKITIKVTDAPFEKSLEYNIAINDVNEFTPILPIGKKFTINENSPAGTAVGNITATDADVTATLSYSITGGDGQSAFSITPTGSISVVDGALLDREAVEYLTIEITVTDGLNAASEDAFIYLNDVNEFAPNVEFFDGSVDENAKKGTLIGKVIASDQDATAKIQFYVSSGDIDKVFAINESTGEVTVLNSSKLDAEKYEYIDLEVLVTDGLYQTVDTVRIVINDVNEFAPEFKNLSLNVPENAPVGFTFGPIEATDKDRTGTVNYYVTGGDGQDFFTIDPTSGLFTVTDNSTFDAETISKFKLITVASDGEFTTTKDLIINITDVNEFSLTVNDAEESYDEGILPGSNLYRPSIKDADKKPVYKFSILTGNEDKIFIIDENSGLVSLAPGNTFDYEKKRLYVLRIGIDDQGELSEFTLTINVKDVLEWSYIQMKPDAGTPLHAFQGLNSHTIRLIPDGDISCEITSDLQLALSDGERYCLFKFTKIPDGIVDKLDQSAQGTFTTIGNNTVEWTVGRATPYNEISWQRPSTHVVDVHSSEGPQFTFDKVTKSADGRYVVTVNGRIASVRSKSAAPINFLMTDEKGAVVIDKQLPSFGYVYLDISDLEPWTEKVYTITANFVDNPLLETIISVPTIVIPNARVEGELVIDRALYDHQDAPVTVKFGEKQGSEFTYIPENVGNWTARIVAKEGANLVTVVDTFPVTSSSHQVIMPKDMFERINNLNIFVQFTLESPIEGYSRIVESRPQRPRIYRGGPVELLASPQNSEGEAPFTADVRLTGTTYHRNSIGAIQWQRSVNGGAFANVADQTRTRIGERVLAGDYVYRAQITNKYSGIVSYTNEVPILAFDAVDISVNGPTYIITGTHSTLEASASIGGVVLADGEAQYDWSYTDTEGQKVLVPGPVLVYQGNIAHNARITLRARPSEASADNRSSFTTKTVSLSIVDPKPLASSIRGPRIAEVDHTYNLEGSTRTPWGDRSASGTIVNEWILPNGDIVKGDKLSWTPSQALLDEVGFGNNVQIQYQSWVEGFKANTLGTGTISIRIWKYEWPSFVMTERKRYQEAPTNITLEVRPEDFNWYRNTYGEPVNYAWDIPAGMELINQIDNRINVRVFEGGVYPVSVTVSDTRGNSTVTEFSTAVGDTPPYTATLVASPTNRYSRVPYDISTQLRSSGGHPENKISNIKYYLNGSLVYEGLNRYPRIPLDTAGTYEYKAVIFTDLGVNTTVTTPVHGYNNKPPVCEHYPSKSSSAYTIEARCTDSDGMIQTYKWYLDGQQLSLTSRRISIALKDIKETGSEVKFIAIDDGGAQKAVSKLYFP